MLISASGIIEQSWRVCIQNFRKLLPYYLNFGFIIFLASLIKFVQPIEFRYGMITNNGVLIFFSEMLWILVFSILTIWSSTAFAIALKAGLEKDVIPSFKEAAIKTSAVFWRVLLTSVATSIIVIFGTVLLIIPGVILSVWYIFSTYEVIFSGKKSFEALTSSKALVLGRWWKVLWRLLVPSLLYGLMMGFFILISLVPLNLHFISKIDTTSLQERVNYLIYEGNAAEITKLTSAEQKTYLINYHPETLLPLPVLLLNLFISAFVYMICIPFSYTSVLALYKSVRENPLEEIPVI